ncbi:MAG: DUF6675 family protein [Candidatus Ornithospirochaeta sp.]
MMTSSLLFASSVRELLPLMDDATMSRLLSGEVLSDSSDVNDISYLVPKDSMITGTFNEISSYEKGFAVAVAALVPYPDKFKGLDKEEMLKELYNYSLTLSTLSGLEYLSHRAGDKMKVLFEEASMLSSSNMKDKISDVSVESVPPSMECYVYLKDTSFGKNVYRVIYESRENELAMTLKNTSEMKFMGISLVAEGKVIMLIDISLTEEGILFAGIGSVKDKPAKMNLLVYTVDLKESFMNRITALKDWYLEKLQ